MRSLFLAIGVFLCLNSFAKTPLQIATEVEQEILSDSNEMPHLKARMDQAMNGALNLAVRELNRKGNYRLANEIDTEWALWFDRSLFTTNRGIGAHKPINQWIADEYDKIEVSLGKDFCIRTHIASIKTMNFGVPVAIRPCSFQMDQITGERIDEYRRHFCGGPNGDDPYWGVVPEIVYWAVYVGCDVGTAGTGWILVCGIAGNVGEKVIGYFVAPNLSDTVYKKSCGG